MVGIVSYGTYIPRWRIKLSDIASAWKKNEEEIRSGLGVEEKAVPGVDEDAVTLGLEASYQALAAGSINPAAVETLLVGSESHPYAVNPTSTIIGELLGVGRHYLAADIEFACKAGTAAVQLIASSISSGHTKMGMAVGTDTAQGKPHDVLEYTAGAGAGAFILGNHHVAAELVFYTSYSSDTPDFWRRDGMRYPTHAGRFTGEPAYFTHVMGASEQLLTQTHMKPSDFDYCVFHMPNGKFPKEVAKRLGFTDTQLMPSFVVPKIGNPYSGSSLLGLAATLDIAKPGKTICMVSYGSGAGSDAFIWKTTKHLVPIQKMRKKKKWFVSDQIENKTMIGYLEYLKKTHKLEV